MWIQNITFSRSSHWWNLKRQNGAAGDDNTVKQLTWMDIGEPDGDQQKSSWSLLSNRISENRIFISHKPTVVNNILRRQPERYAHHLSRRFTGRCGTPTHVHVIGSTLARGPVWSAARSTWFCRILRNATRLLTGWNKLHHFATQRAQVVIDAGRMEPHVVSGAPWVT